MKSLAQRQSHRECADKDLSKEDLSNLLWAANGINRTADNKRTAPSALNRQDIDVYVISRNGAYKYVAAENRLQLITEGDHRGAVAGGQDFVKGFPVSLVLVSELSRLGDAKNERTRMTAAMDAGYVSQNICPVLCRQRTRHGADGYHGYRRAEEDTAARRHGSAASQQSCRLSQRQVDAHTPARKMPYAAQMGAGMSWTICKGGCRPHPAATSFHYILSGENAFHPYKVPSSIMRSLTSGLPCFSCSMLK